MLNFLRKMSSLDHFLEHFFGPLQWLTAIILGLDVMWYIFFSIWVFLTQTFTNHRTVWEGGGHFFNSLLPLPPASQTLRHQLGDYCRELTSAHSQQLDSNQEPLVSEHKSLPVYMCLYIFSKITYEHCSELIVNYTSFFAHNNM